MVERMTVNHFVVGSNPIWEDYLVKPDLGFRAVLIAYSLMDRIIDYGSIDIGSTPIKQNKTWICSSMAEQLTFN